MRTRLYSKASSDEPFEMNELPRNPDAVDTRGVRSEEVLKPMADGEEVRVGEGSGKIERLSTSMVEHVVNGTPAELVERSLDAVLDRPEVQDALVREFSPYSDEVNAAIRSYAELKVYLDLGLTESTINDTPCLQRDINLDLKDEMGRTNEERMERGLCPIDEHGDRIELHHIGQKEDSPLAELSSAEHNRHSSELHDNSSPTEVHGQGNQWNVQRQEYWKERLAKMKEAA